MKKRIVRLETPPFPPNPLLNRRGKTGGRVGGWANHALWIPNEYLIATYVGAPYLRWEQGQP
jgi:hypothetical protein